MQYARRTGLVQRLLKLSPNGLFRLVYKLREGYVIKNRIHLSLPVACY